MNRKRWWRRWFLLLPLALVCTGCMEGDRFVVNIQRHFATPEEEALIGIAERVCPAREDVLAAADPEERDALDAEAGENCLWWYDYSKVRIPYGITVDAIDYFVERVDKFRQLPSIWPFVFPSAGLDYQAGIEFRDSFTNGDKQYDNIYLVDMTMSYGESLAFLAGTGF